MKIAFVCQDLVGQGVEYATAIIARAFAHKGWDVDILVSQVHFDLLKEGKKSFELPSAVKIVPMPNRRGCRNGVFLRKYLKTGGADIVLAESGIYSWCMTWASFGIPKRKLPKLAQVHHGTGPEPKGFWSTARMYLGCWYHYRKFFAYMFVEEQAMKNARRFMRFNRQVRLAVVNNACVDAIFNEKVKLSPTHPWLAQKTCPTLVSAGAYEPYKGHLTLLRAVKLLKDQGRRLRVVIFGRGGLQSKYEDFIRENDLEDWVSVGSYSDRLPAEIKASDGFVLSSNWESFGIVLGEALACGVPCISTDAPYGPREILDNGRFGRLVPVADPKAMATAMVDLLAGKIPVAPAESWQRYTIEAIEKRYFDALGIL